MSVGCYTTVPCGIFHLFVTIFIFTEIFLFTKFRQNAPKKSIQILTIQWKKCSWLTCARWFLWQNDQSPLERIFLLLSFLLPMILFKRSFIWKTRFWEPMFVYQVLLVLFNFLHFGFVEKSWNHKNHWEVNKSLVEEKNVFRRIEKNVFCGNQSFSKESNFAKIKFKEKMEKNWKDGKRRGKKEQRIDVTLKH